MSVAKPRFVCSAAILMHQTKIAVGAG